MPRVMPPFDTTAAVKCALSHSRSQLSEDLILLPTLLSAARWRPSAFVELGALDGVSLSNTIMLERCFNWTGLLIEASPRNFAGLRNAPRTAAKVHSAVCNQPGTLRFADVRGPVAGQLDVRPMGARTSPTPGSQRTGGVEVPCAPLGAMMAEHKLRSPAFLSLDVEGAEEHVLRTVDPRTFSVVVIERSAFDAPKNARVHVLMTTAGMRLAAHLCVRASNIYLAPGVNEVHVPVPTNSPYRTAPGLVHWRPSHHSLLRSLDAARVGERLEPDRVELTNSQHDECVAVESYGGAILRASYAEGDQSEGANGRHLARMVMEPAHRLDRPEARIGGGAHPLQAARQGLSRHDPTKDPTTKVRHGPTKDPTTKVRHDPTKERQGLSHTGAAHHRPEVCSHWMAKNVGNVAAQVANSSASSRLASTRRAWSLITVGFEMTMLRLHMRSMQHVVAGFLVVEATSTYNAVNTGSSPGDAPDKPALLTNALESGAWPADLANMTRVRVLSAAAERAWCKQRMNRLEAFKGPTGCYESRHRYALLELLFSVAAPGDVAILADVDELASPSAVRMLLRCAPWWGDETRATNLTALESESGAWPADLANMTRVMSPLPARYVLLSWELKFGVHCWPGAAEWMNGPHAVSVSWLRAAVSRLSAMEYRFLRERQMWRNPTVKGAGWHLTSWGEPWELRRKLTTWGHADMFQEKQHAGVLDAARLERCARNCLSPLGDLDQTWPAGGKKPAWHAPATPCANRSGPRELRLRGTVLTNATLSRATLPTYLLNHRADYPSYFRYL